MEEETLVSSEVPVMKAAEDVVSNANPIKVTNGELPVLGKEGKREEEETDGEFIKVEKESKDVKDASHTDVTVSVIERSSSNPSRELLEAQEKIRELEFELERVAGAFKHSESENSQLKEEVSLTKEKLVGREKKYEELELSHNKMQQHIVEAEEKHSTQINILQEELRAQEAKSKELIEVKEALDGLSLELESSRKRMQELEDDLQCSAGETQKFEDLHKQSGSHAESETKRALEFERLLEVTKLTAKEMEDQMASLQEELKGLYDKIAENQKVEEALKTTAAELSAVQEELTLSKSQVLDIEQRLSSREDLINELTQDLDSRKASESQVKEHVLSLENHLASTKEDLQLKVSELVEIKLRHQDETNSRELVETALKTQEAQVSAVQDELAKVLEEKEALKVAVAEMASKAKQLEELHSNLEEKLRLSYENFNQTDSLLSQALSNNSELEQKLRSLEELHNETGVAAATTTQKNLELEDIIQASNAAAEEAKLQLRELETRCIAAEQKNVELEQQLNFVELKSSDTEREIKEVSDKISELNATLRVAEEEKVQLNGQMLEYQEKITLLESALDQSSLRNSELVEELKIAVGKCTEHEDRASMNHQRSLELEDLIQLSHSKVEDASKRASELELLLETEKYRIQELEEQISTLEIKCGDVEADSEKQSHKVAQLASELKAFQARVSSLEISLQTAHEKERELIESLNTATNEKKRLEDASISSGKKLAEAENLSEVLRNELNLTLQKLESIEIGLKASGVRESEVMEKLKYAEEQLEQHGRLIEQTTARNTELELLHDSLSRDSEGRLQEAIENFNNRDSEAKSLLEKLRIHEDQVKIYEEQVAQAAGKTVSLKAELDQTLLTLASLENINEELREQISNAENRASQSLSENELLVETNVQLKSKIDELQELVNSALSEKEATTQQLFSHKNTVIELTDQHSRALELHSAAEVRIAEAERQLQEAVHRFSHRDSEAKDLSVKLNALETQIELYKEQAQESSTIAEARNIELEQTLSKLKHLESIVEELQTKSRDLEKETGGLAVANMKLTEEVATYESKLSNLQAKLLAALAEKDETVEQLNSSKKAIEVLTHQLASEGQKLQSQISSIMEENNHLSETHQNSKKELESVILQLEEKLKEQNAKEDALKSEIENLKAEIDEKPVLQTRLKELEEQLMKSEDQLKQEVQSIQLAAAGKEAELISKLEDHVHKVQDRDLLQEKVLELQKELQLAQNTHAEQKEKNSRKDLKREAALEHSLEGLEAKNREIMLLEKQVKELEQKLQQADDKLSRKMLAVQLNTRKGWRSNPGTLDQPFPLHQKGRARKSQKHLLLKPHLLQRPTLKLLWFLLSRPISSSWE
ncbi:hypothetical protein I3760_04G076600 [Carya illinoinensis]|nr:hypothetical protein I3760_04G076600 [Carya illinoinensis]